METKTLARIGAIAFATIAIIVAVIDGTRRPEPPALTLAPPMAAASGDPLAPELDRCGALGEAGERDAGCLAAWAKNRRRFLGEEQ